MENNFVSQLQDTVKRSYIVGDSQLTLRKKVILKLLDNKTIQQSINKQQHDVYVTDANIIDDDILSIGVIRDKILTIDFPVITIQIDLTIAISQAITEKKYDIIRKMLEYKINVAYHQPQIMMLCAQMGADEMLTELINHQMSIHDNNYRCVYYLASVGKLDLLKLIIATYTFPDMHEVIGKIMVQAILNNHVNVIEYFCPLDGFDSAPDVIFTYFLSGIRYTTHLDVIKYFINGGVCIQQQDYEAITMAKNHNRSEMIRYFVELDPSVLSRLTEDEKIKYNLVEELIESQDIGIDHKCGIIGDSILESDRYYQCEKKMHVYKEAIWKEWMKRSNRWKCPLCFCTMDSTIYVNK